MQRAISQVVYTTLALLVISGVSATQVLTGTPPFSSIGGGPFDSVNLGNLNVHFLVPVLHKAGRGMPFSYALAYESSVWVPTNSSGQSTWTPVFNWGWSAQTSAATKTGYVSTSASHITCDSGQALIFGNWVYRDAWGTVHAFAGRIAWNPGNCGVGLAHTFLNAAATDGSGLTLAASFNSTGGLNPTTITTRDGTVMTPPVNSMTGSDKVATTATDTNGNQITSDGTGHFYDTLSSATPVLTLGGTGTVSSPNTFTYTPPSGTNVSYTMNYVQYTVATAFGVSGITEYGRQSNALVSSIQLPDGTSYSFTYEQTPGSCTPLANTAAHCVTGRIATVSLPTGGTITYNYSGGSNGIESDGSTAGLTRILSPATSCASGGCWQYSRSGSGSAWTTTMTDPAANQTVMKFAKDGSTSNPTFNFYETQRQMYQGSVSATACSSVVTNNCLLLTKITCYSFHYSSCATAAVSSPISATDSYTQLTNGSTRDSERVYNSSGLVTDAREYNYGVALGAPPSATYLVLETAITYANYGKPASINVYDWSSGTSVTLASSTFTYDEGTPAPTSGTPQHVAVSGPRGNLTTVSASTSSTAALSRTYTYYDTGTPNVTTDVNGAQTSYVYSSLSCGNAFPTTINEPLSLSRLLTWNCTGAVTTQVTDENGKNSTSNYTDADFWRPASLVDQMSNQTNISYTGQTAVETALQNFNGGLSSSDYLNTVDGFGRQILNQRLQGPAASNYDTVEQDYNNIGLPSRTTLPFAALAGGTSSTAPAVNTTYDALGRVQTATDANGGAVSYTYVNNDVLQQVSGGQTFKRQFEYDGLGRLTSVCEITAGTSAWPGGNCAQSSPQTGYWTKYDYNALGNLLKVTQNAQGSTTQVRLYSYDLLSRLTSETNPESNSVAATYTYDTDNTCGTSKGDRVKKIDTATNVTCTAFDALHRPTIVTYPSGPNATATPTKTFVYDAATVNSKVMQLAKGRLAEAYTGPTASKTTDLAFSYDADGRIVDFYESTPHSSGYYDVTASYWATGVLDTLKGVSLPTLTYGLEGEGRQNTVSASSGVSPVSSTSYNTTGQVTDVTFGSSDPVHFGFDSNTGRMTQYKLTINGTATHGDPTWNANGTLGSLAITDSFNASDAQTCNYGYDDLSRLASVDCGAAHWQQNFTYDPFGNVTKTVPTGATGISFNPGYDLKNRYTSIGAYDSNGNLTNDGTDHIYAWDVDGNSVTLDSRSIVYDALGREVELQNSGTNTEFVYGPTGKLALMNGQTQTKAYVALPGGTQVKYIGNAISTYRLPDWLGSLRIGSNPNRTYSWGIAFAPFGEQYASSGGPALSFTGEQGTADSITDEYDFLYRKFHSAQGRWVSPDPAGLSAADTTNPQSWNRYAYVLSNPLALTDPTGLCAALDYTYTDENGSPVFHHDSGPCPTVDSGFVWHNWAQLEPAGTTSCPACARIAMMRAVRPPPRLKPSCTNPALWAGLKAAGADFFSPPGADPVADIGDALRDKNVQRAAVGTLYVAANSARYLSPALDVAADFVPVVGEVLLAYQVGHALYEGGKAYAESIDQCYERP
jgi:RHS repeat-associated protein